MSPFLRLREGMAVMCLPVGMAYRTDCTLILAPTTSPNPDMNGCYAYAEEFNIPVIPYPNAEGSWLPYNDNDLRMIGGKFYTNKMLADPETLTGLGFNSREVQFLSKHPWYELQGLYLQHYVDKFKDPYQPFGIGFDDLDNVSITEIYKKEGASQAAIKHLGGEHTSALYSYMEIGRHEVSRHPAFRR